MESGGTKEDSPANTQQSARREPISSQTEWLASGTPCLRRSSNQSPSTSSVYTQEIYFRQLYFTFTIERLNPKKSPGMNGVYLN